MLDVSMILPCPQHVQELLCLGPDPQLVLKHFPGRGDSTLLARILRRVAQNVMAEVAGILGSLQSTTLELSMKSVSPAKRVRGRELVCSLTSSSHATVLGLTMSALLPTTHIGRAIRFQVACAGLLQL